MSDKLKNKSYFHKIIISVLITFDLISEFCCIWQFIDQKNACDVKNKWHNAIIHDFVIDIVSCFVLKNPLIEGGSFFEGVEEVLVLEQA